MATITPTAPTARPATPAVDSGEDSGPGSAHGVVDPCGDEAHEGRGGGDEGHEQVADDDELRARHRQDRVHGVQVRALVLREQGAGQEGDRQDAHGDGGRRPAHDEIRRGDDGRDDDEAAQLWWRGRTAPRAAGSR